jgi:cytidylate kinase
MNYRDLSLSLAEALVRSHLEGAARPEQPSPPAPFTITISREAGALGNSVAAEVGRRLGWPVYDREILDKIAEELRRPPSRLEAVDERPASWLEECLSALGDQHHVSPDTYFKYLNGVVRGLGVVGHCLIVGRGANFILPAQTTLRVRLVALPEDRARVVAQRLGLPAGEAAAWVVSTERQRRAFIKRYFRQDPTVPHHYDLVLNTSRLAVDEAADVIIQALRQFEGRSAPSGHPEPGLEKPMSAALT